MKKYKLIYSEQGTSYPDHQAEWVASTLSKRNVNTSSSIVVQAALTLIAEEKLDINLVEFYFEDTKIEVNKYGIPENAPIGFIDTNVNLITRAVKAGIERRNIERIGTVRYD